MPLVSVRMRASLRGEHVSGAERIVSEDFIDHVVCELMSRPSRFDELVLTLERLGEVQELRVPLEASSFTFTSVESARHFAVKQLLLSGVPKGVAVRSVELLSKGASPKNTNMRGAVLMDINTGERLEEDPFRGVRTVRVDWKDRSAVESMLTEKGFTLRTVDALAIALKNRVCGVMAELCWSDDPDYLTGYVSSEKLGYVRITPLKRKGDPLGGRIYFIERKKLREVVRCLEEKAFLLELLPT